MKPMEILQGKLNEASDHDVLFEQIEILLKKRGYSFDYKRANAQLKRDLHRIVLFLKDKDGNKAVFRALVDTTGNFVGYFKNEIRILRIVRKNKRLSAIFRPSRMIERGRKPTLWGITSFIEGTTTGNIFEFDKDKLNNRLISFLVKSLKNIPKIVIPRRGNYFIKKTKKSVELLLRKCQRHPFLVKYHSRLEDIYNMNKPYIEDKNNYYSSHSDLVPLNILTDGKNFSLIDWEHAGHDLLTVDPIQLYVRSWRHPEWQKKFYSQLIKIRLKRKKDQKNFMFQSILYLAKDIYNFSRMIDCKKYHKWHNVVMKPAYLKMMQKTYMKKFTELIESY